MCDCIRLVNEALAEKNTVLDIPLRLNLQTGQSAGDRMVVATAKRDTRSRTPRYTLMASHCPMCGEAYPNGGHNAETS